MQMCASLYVTGFVWTLLHTAFVDMSRVLAEHAIVNFEEVLMHIAVVGRLASAPRNATIPWCGNLLEFW
eukprot:10677808-Karenia_brevis.AAC.1